MPKKIQRFDDFHAGYFLHEIMQEKGHDIAWLALPTELFFMERVDGKIFGSKTAA